MARGKLFEFSDNLIRVTLSRLVAKGTIENFERGHYRLTRQSDPVNDFVEEWRQGEKRRKPWKKDRFLVAHPEAAAERDIWILETLGFRQIRGGFWCRPDNLARTHEELIDLMKRLGMEGDLLLGSDVHFGENDSTNVVAQYDPASLSNSYRKLSHELRESLDRLSHMDREQAMMESFQLGGAAIQVLAKDPLLPEEIQDASDRHELWQTMLTYDKAGRAVWSGQETEPTVMPASMASYGEPSAA